MSFRGVPAIFAILLCFPFIFILQAQAGDNQSLIYQGRIVRPDQTVLNAGVVRFTLSVYSPLPAKCLLYAETQNIDMTGSLGMFSLQLGAGTRTDGGSHTFKEVFINGSTLSGLTCASGTSYTASATDDRTLQVSFDDAGTVVNLSAMAIKSVPFALQAHEVDGWGLNNLVKVSTVGSPTTFTTAEMANAKLLTAPGPCAVNEILKWNGSAWGCSADATGGSPSDASYLAKGVFQADTDAATSGLVFSAAGILKVNYGTGANQIVKLDAASKLPAVDASALTNLNASNLSSGTIPISRGGTGAATKTAAFDALSPNSAKGDITVHNGTNNISLPRGSDGQVLTTDSAQPSGLKWANAAATGVTSVSAGTGLTGGTITSTGTLSVNVGTGANQIVQLDASAKLPAVDGSALTNLSSSQISAGTLPVSKGGTGNTSFSGHAVILSDATGSQLQALTCAAGSVLSFDISGYPVCGSGGASGFLNGGNSFGANASLGTNDNKTLSFRTNSTDRMTIDATGAVTVNGVADSAPTAFQVNKNSQYTNVSYFSINNTDALGDMGFMIGNNSGTNGMKLWSAGTSYTPTLYRNRISLTNPANGGLGFEATNASGDIRFSTGGDLTSKERLRIDSSGNMGLGTTSPAAKLDISSSTTSATAHNEIGQRTTVSNTGVVTAGTDNTYGNKISVSRSGATGGTINAYGQYIDVSFPGDSGATDNLYGSYIYLNGGFLPNTLDKSYGYAVVDSPADTALHYGFYADMKSGISGSTVYGFYADTTSVGASNPVDYGLYAKVGTGAGAGGQAYGLYVDATSGAGGSAYGLYVDVTNGFRATNYAGIFKGGNVGIGTTTPGAPLDVKGEVRMSGATSGYAGLKSPATGPSITWTLPTADGSAGQFLKTDGSGNLSWASASSSAITSLNGLTAATQTFAIGTSGNSPNFSSATATHTLNIPMASTASVTAGLISKTDYDSFSNKLGTTVSFGGDVTGVYNATSVDKIKGSPLSMSSLSSGDFLKYNGSAWVNSGIAASDIASGTLPVSRGGTGVVSLTANRLLASDGTGSALQAVTPCSQYQVLSFDGSGIYGCYNISSLAGFINNGNSFGVATTLGTNDNQALNFETFGTTHMTIDTAGNVGIGTTSPTYAFEVSNPTSLATTLNSKSFAAEFTFNLGAGGNDSRLQVLANRNTGAQSGHDYGDFRIQRMIDSTPMGYIAFNGGAGTIANRGVQLGFNDTPAMTVIANGNVGIGTATPSMTLDTRTTSASTAATTIYNTGSLLTASPASASSSKFQASLIQMDFASGASSSPSAQIYGLSLTSNNNSGGTVGISDGIWSASVNNSTGTIGTAHGVSASVRNVSTGVVSDGYGVYSTIYNPSGTVTNGYGVYVDTVAATNKWSVYANDSTAPSYFAGKVGIGINAPTDNLHVIGSARVDGEIIVEAESNPVTSRLQISQNNIQNNGAPDLALVGKQNYTYLLNTDDLGIISFREGTNFEVGAEIKGVATENHSATANGTQLEFFTTPNTTLGIQQRMVIGPNGWVGVNESTPLTFFQIGSSADKTTPEQLFLGAYSSAGSGRPTILGNWASNGRWGIGAASGAMDDTLRVGYISGFNADWDSNQGNFTLVAKNMYTENKLSVGLAPSSSSYAFHAQDSQANSWVANINNTNTGASAGGLRIQINAANPGSSNDYVSFYKGTGAGTVIGHIAGNTGSNVQYLTTSDRRLKENIRDTHYSLSDLMKIKVRDYNYIDSNINTTGFIAQDLYEIYPDAVNKPLDESKGTWGVDYGLVTPLIVKSVQELHGMCKMSERQIQSIQEKVAAHERRLASVEEENKNLKKENQDLKRRLELIEKRLGLTSPQN